MLRLRTHVPPDHELSQMTQRQACSLPPVCVDDIPVGGELCCLSYEVGFNIIEVELLYIGEFGYYRVPMDADLAAVVMRAFIEDVAKRLSRENHTLH
jgi:hypothetical protein